jgi:Fur family transcriptional regulator, peroxide stress response regulator
VALFDVLRQCTSHPTAEELYRMTRDCTTGLSRATVYNTLEALCRAGLARQMAGTNGCSRYDANTQEHLHIRLDNDEIRDVPHDLGVRLMENLPQDVLDDIERRLGVQIDGVSVQLIGRTRGNGFASA